VCALFSSVWNQLNSFQMIAVSSISITVLHSKALWLISNYCLKIWQSRCLRPTGWQARLLLLLKCCNEWKCEVGKIVCTVLIKKTDTISLMCKQRIRHILGSGFTGDCPFLLSKSGHPIPAWIMWNSVRGIRGIRTFILNRDAAHEVRCQQLGQVAWQYIATCTVHSSIITTTRLSCWSWIWKLRKTLELQAVFVLAFIAHQVICSYNKTQKT